MTQRTPLFTNLLFLLLGTLPSHRAHAESAALKPIIHARRIAPMSPGRRLVSASTRDLYHFHRDDAAPGGVTRITLDAGHVAAKPVSQNVFGNFIENLNAVIYDNLWADALHDGSLERIEPTNREPPYWDQTGTAAWLEAPGSGYLSQRSVRLSGPDGTLSQRVYLPAYRVRGYTLTLWTRAPAGAGRVTLAVRAGGEADGPFHAGLEAAGQAAVQTELTASAPAWQKQTVHWTLPAGASRRARPRVLSSRTPAAGAGTAGS